MTLTNTDTKICCGAAIFVRWHFLLLLLETVMREVFYGQAVMAHKPQGLSAIQSPPVFNLTWVFYLAFLIFFTAVRWHAAARCRSNRNAGVNGKKVEHPWPCMQYQYVVVSNPSIKTPIRHEYCVVGVLYQHWCMSCSARLCSIPDVFLLSELWWMAMYDNGTHRHPALRLENILPTDWSCMKWQTCTFRMSLCSIYFQLIYSHLFEDNF